MPFSMVPVAVLVNQEMPIDPAISQLIVRDTQTALGQISAHICRTVNPFCFALTGSCGKTTVKEMLTAIVQQQHTVHMTQR